MANLGDTHQGPTGRSKEEGPGPPTHGAVWLGKRFRAHLGAHRDITSISLIFIDWTELFQFFKSYRDPGVDPGSQVEATPDI